MAAALSVQQLMKKTPDSMTAELVIWGNLAALALIFSIVFGAYHLTLWMVLGSVLVTFPILYFVILQRILKGAMAARIYGVIGLLSAAGLYFQW
ncbi:hypothetical protein ACKC9G_02320 [Pokkaliibacter sp. CJK22405]|uniref:hypothetical protein n=1 Tax=Pokkaliibacter sp. CJK22405 TaxID=3384615 RepID=UPI0039846659